MQGSRLKKIISFSLITRKNIVRQWRNNDRDTKNLTMEDNCLTIAFVKIDIY